MRAFQTPRFSPSPRVLRSAAIVVLAGGFTTLVVLAATTVPTDVQIPESAPV